MSREVEVFYEGLDFGEGPRWHDGRLWVSDFYAHQVLSFDPGGAPRVEVQLDDQPSGLGWLPSGDLLVVAMRSRQVRRRDADGRVHLHAELSSIATGDCNDMVVDARGNAYVGNFGPDTEGADRARRVADLTLVRPDGTVEVAAEQLRFPNGSVITADGATLIVGESMGARYTAFTIGDDGGLSDRRTWAEVPGKAPDGCALDADGCLWMADALRGRLLPRPGGRRDRRRGHGEPARVRVRARGRRSTHAPPDHGARRSARSSARARRSVASRSRRSTSPVPAGPDARPSTGGEVPAAWLTSAARSTSTSRS